MLPNRIMNYSSATYKQLIKLCQEYHIKGYSAKNKSELVSLLQEYSDKNQREEKAIEVIEEKETEEKVMDLTTSSTKKERGQFYTSRSSYILEGLHHPPPHHHIHTVIEPFAGKGDLVEWIRSNDYPYQVESYDIDPKMDYIIQRDTLTDPPFYKDAWVITNPPYLARNKTQDKTLFDKYNTNDLYKCFLMTLTQRELCSGGMLIIPAGFFLSPRDVDVRCRNLFMTKYKITRVNYFEEQVFHDTTTTVVAFSFLRSDQEMKEQEVEWRMMPSNTFKTFTMSSSNGWIVGGDIYHLPVRRTIQIRRHVEGVPLKHDELQTYMTITALDSGKKDGKISMKYEKGYIYPAKETSRTYATLRISGVVLDESQQIQLCQAFNHYINQKRDETWSLFLPQFRESKEYARKRIPFELVYRICHYLIETLLL